MESSETKLCRIRFLLRNYPLCAYPRIRKRKVQRISGRNGVSRTSSPFWVLTLALLKKRTVEDGSRFGGGRPSESTDRSVDPSVDGRDTQTPGSQKETVRRDTDCEGLRRGRDKTLEEPPSLASKREGDPRSCLESHNTSRPELYPDDSFTYLLWVSVYEKNSETNIQDWTRTP